jgi:hypothetical protein
VRSERSNSEEETAKQGNRKQEQEQENRNSNGLNAEDGKEERKGRRGEPGTDGACWRVNLEVQQIVGVTGRAMCNR